MAAGTIRAGIGGWIFEPWRGSFYPAKLSKTQELAHASRQIPTIEINSTFYRTQSPSTFAKWAREVPEGFVFSLKAVRYATQKRVLAEAGESVDRFVKSGIVELGDKLGPILWQFADKKAFQPDDFAAFLKLLPSSVEGHALRHAVELRHASFLDPQAVRLAREAGVAIVYAQDEDYAEIADVTGDFVYARLQKGRDEIETGYELKALDEWAERARLWAAGDAPGDLPLMLPDEPARKTPRDVFVYFIREGKSRAPQAAMALMERINAHQRS
ncbi:DUF72 domain-containing protein [Aureimonas populi]|uniref:DUF72 domain-containing protein n=1 Tax=Aureimonas populi TaxID=1701758 RepID=A0ABW5CNA3_9HYPH|nr:DUF72 domain-containing protein [Aureimonas populi]